MSLVLFVFVQQGLDQCLAHVRCIRNILINYQSNNLLQSVNRPLLLPNFATLLVTNQSHDFIILQDGFLSIMFIPQYSAIAQWAWPCHQGAPVGTQPWKNECWGRGRWRCCLSVTDGLTWGRAVKDSISEEAMFELQDSRDNTLCRQMMLPMCASPGTFPSPLSEVTLSWICIYHLHAFLYSLTINIRIPVFHLYISGTIVFMQ